MESRSERTLVVLGASSDQLFLIRTARELGLTVDVEADEHTIPGLVAALERHFS